MASLSLTKSWLNRLDTGEGIAAYTAPTAPRQYTVEGEVSTWAGGRQRALSTPGEKGSWPITMLIVSAAAVATLRSWIGIPVAFRDPYGVRFVGVFWAVAPVARRGEPGLFNAEFVLQAVTTVDGA